MHLSVQFKINSSTKVLDLTKYAIDALLRMLEKLEHFSVRYYKGLDSF